MTKLLVAILLAVSAGACSRQSEKPIAIATWDEVNSLAEAFVLRGEVTAVRRHSDFSGVPPETLRQLNGMLDDWHGVSSDLRHAETKVLTFAEYEAFQEENRKALPEFIRNVPSRIKWNVRPEKVIVFTFASKDPQDTNTVVRYSTGAYQTNGLWYFATSFSE